MAEMERGGAEVEVQLGRCGVLCCDGCSGGKGGTQLLDVRLIVLLLVWGDRVWQLLLHV